MKQSFKEIVNKALGNMGENLPQNRASGCCWGEVELPDCLRAELEEADSRQDSRR